MDVAEAPVEDHACSTSKSTKKQCVNPWQPFRGQVSKQLTWDNRIDVIAAIPVPDNCYFINYKPPTVNKITGEITHQFVCNGFRCYGCDLYLKVVNRSVGGKYTVIL